MSSAHLSSNPKGLSGNPKVPSEGEGRCVVYGWLLLIKELGSVHR